MEEKRAVYVNFDAQTKSIDFERVAVGREAVTQSVLVEIGTRRGSRTVYPKSGTDLPDFVKGAGSASWFAAAHAGNFAALDAQTFVARFVPAEFKLKTVRLVASAVRGSQAEYDVVIEYKDGVVVGASQNKAEV